MIHFESFKIIKKYLKPTVYFSLEALVKTNWKSLSASIIRLALKWLLFMACALMDTGVSMVYAWMLLNILFNEYMYRPDERTKICPVPYGSRSPVFQTDNKHI